MTTALADPPEPTPEPDLGPVVAVFLFVVVVMIAFNVERLLGVIPP